jgi:hypothetical protein
MSKILQAPNDIRLEIMGLRRRLSSLQLKITNAGHVSEKRVALEYKARVGLLCITMTSLCQKILASLVQTPTRLNVKVSYLLKLEHLLAMTPCADSYGVLHSISPISPHHRMSHLEVQLISHPQTRDLNFGIHNLTINTVRCALAYAISACAAV